MGANTQTNNKSVVSLTLGILSIVIPFIGLVLGIIGTVVSRVSVKEIEKTKESGKGLATSGLICSIVGIIIQLFGLLGIIAFNFLTTTVG